jgi:hypothetical protein
LPAGLLPGFVGGQKQKAGGAIEAFFVAGSKAAQRQWGGNIHFARDLDALAGDVEKRDGFDGDTAQAEAFRILFPANAERSHDARARDDHARRSTESMKWWKQHVLGCHGLEHLRKDYGHKSNVAVFSKLK